MSNDRSSATEDLDALLSAGHITEEEYHTLSAAMKPAEPQAKPEGSRKRLMRSHRQRMLTGVCAGLAEYLGMPVVGVRLLFLVALLTGVWILLVYAVLSAAIPLKKEENAAETRSVKVYYFVSSAIFLTINAFAAFVTPALIDIYRHLDLQQTSSMPTPNRIEVFFFRTAWGYGWFLQGVLLILLWYLYRNAPPRGTLRLALWVVPLAGLLGYALVRVWPLLMAVEPL